MFDSKLLSVKILEGFNFKDILDASIEVDEKSLKFYFQDHTVCINKTEIKNIELIPLTEYLKGITAGKFTGVPYINSLINYGSNVASNILVFNLDSSVIVFECKKSNAILEKFDPKIVNKISDKNIFYNTPPEDKLIKHSLLSFSGEYLGGTYIEDESFLHYIYLLDEKIVFYKQQQINFPSLFKIDFNVKYSDIKKVSIENYESLLEEYYNPQNGYFHYADLVVRSKSKGYYDEIKDRKILKLTYEINGLKKKYLIEVRNNIENVFDTINSKIQIK